MWEEEEVLEVSKANWGNKDLNWEIKDTIKETDWEDITMKETTKLQDKVEG